ncbi:MAG: toll/interleukin-1 receptor domain-containing protein [Gammaproteobacteria bacterium]|nr:toll/interleukin-1 receptor domain-containing protein [Gammaproteobacteria bacterium]
MSDIFISYAREDRAVAQAMAAALDSRGWSVWWDREIRSGEAFDRVIEEALSRARCVIVLWSSASISSRWVRAEAAEGLRRKCLIPIFIEDVRPPLAFRRLHAERLTEVDITTTSGVANAPLRKVLEDVAALLDRPERVGAADTVAARPTASKRPVRRRTVFLLAAAALVLATMVGRAWLAPSPNAYLGVWSGPVQYSWGVRVEERFEFSLTGEQIAGVGTFLTVSRRLERLRIEDGVLQFSIDADATTDERVVPFRLDYSMSLSDERLNVRVTDSRAGYRPLVFYLTPIGRQ